MKTPQELADFLQGKKNPKTKIKDAFNEFFNQIGDEENLKGEDGKDGLDGKDGKDGVDGKDGLDGKDGIDGKDGKTIIGKDGKDGRDGIGKDGKDGRDGIEIEPKEIVSKLKTLKGADRLPLSAINENELLMKIGSTVGKKINTLDERWHGGGLTKVATDTTLSGDGTPDNPLHVNDDDTAYLKLDQTTPQTIFGGPLTIKDTSSQLLSIDRTGIFDSVQTFLQPATYTNITTEAGISLGTVSGDLINSNGDYIYLGKVDKFSNIYFDIATAMSVGPTMTFEYSTTGDTWTTLTGVTDGTNALTVDGVISFAIPSDWEIDTVNGVTNLYWVRIGTSGTAYSTEPTAYLIVPNDGQPVVEIYANGGDTTPTIGITRNGNVFMGFSSTSTTPPTYKLAVSGSTYLGGTLVVGGTGSFTGAVTSTPSATGFAFNPGFSVLSTSATAILPSQNSPVNRFTSAGWNGFVTKANAMDIYVNPDSEPITQSRMAFKNTTENGYPEQSELMNLDNDGVLSILGRAQSSWATFDSVQDMRAPSTFTDDTLAVQTLGLITGDVLNVVGDFLYIGKRDTFGSIYFDFETIMSAGTNRTWEYWNGSVWTALTVTDGTNQWQNDGTVTFTPPVGWAKNTVNSVGPIYYIRVGTVSGTFTVEPTLRFCLPQARVDVFSNGEFDTATGWDTAGDWAYSTQDETFTFNTGSGTLKQQAVNFANPAKPNTWYRFRYVVGVAGPSTTVAYIGDEFATGKTYFQTTSTTEVDVFFKSNSNPQDFIIYTTATATSGFRLDAVELIEVTGGDLMATGNIEAKTIKITSLPTYANNAAAITGGLTAGEFYTTGIGDPRPVYIVY